jgi:glycosyltransferase involved in cell wall biosynthesis
MKLIAVLSAYGDHSTSGAAIMNMWLLRELVKHGHEVEIWGPTRVSGANHNGIQSYYYREGLQQRRFRDADVILTAPDVAGRIGGKVIQQTGLPAVAIIHNTWAANQKYYNRNKWDLTIWGAESSRIEFEATGGIVVRPPLNVKAHKAGWTNAKNITMINMIEHKGPRTFWNVATLMPERPFLGVRTWGPQMDTHPEGLVLSNVTIDQPYLHTEMKQLWRKTRVLLAPTSYEPWGMAMDEAMAAGRPVIGHPSRGLVENLSYAGIWADRDNPQEWVDAIKTLDDPKVFKEQSEKCYQRALEIEQQAISDLGVFVRTMEERYA